MNKTNIFIMIFVLVIVIAGGVVFTNKQLGATTDTPTGNFISGTGGYLSVPTYGYIQCREGFDLTYNPSLYEYNKFSSIIIRCQDYGTLLQSCIVNFKMPSSGEVSKQASGLTYRVCDNADTACALTGTGTVTKYARYVYVNTGELNAVYSVPLQSNQFIIAQYNEADILSVFFSKDTAVNKGRYQIAAKPWFLYRYDIFSLTQGQPVPGTEDCTDVRSLGEANLYIESVSGGGKLTQQLRTNTLNIDTAMRARGATFYYLSNFVSIIPQYEMFPDGSKYCYDKKIYAVETVETSGGTYKVANTGTNAQLQTVECCNGGDAGPGYYCKDFKRVPISGSGGQSCSALNPCPIVGYQPVTNKQVVYQTCDNGVCSNPKYMTVKCNNAFDCNGGYCMVDPLNPANNYCKTIQPTESCGNGACEASRGETVASCPKDCAPAKNDSNLLMWIIVGILVVVVLVVIILLVTSKRK